MVEVRILGAQDVRGPDGESLLSVLVHPKQFAVLSYLCVTAWGAYVSRDRLLAVFWPESDECRGRNALNQILHWLRKSLGSDVFLTRGVRDVGLSADHLWCDAEALGRAVKEGRNREALDLYAGQLLEGFHLGGSQEFDAWLSQERRRLRELAAGAAWTVAHDLLTEGRLGDAERTAQRATMLSGAAEGEARRFIRALAAAGDRAAAVRFYDRFAERLANDLELRPNAETRKLVDDIRASKGVGEAVARAGVTDRASTQSASVLDRLRASLADRYFIEREIGRGGMATVYLAHDLKHDRTVAFKVLAPDLAATVGTDRFLREIKTAAKLAHPHILPLIDSGRADGLLYYVMPHVEGESLRARLDREGRLAVDDAVRITREIADALAYAHEKQVLHRDVKPSNILLEAGHAVLADFGVARALAEADDGATAQTDEGGLAPAGRTDLTRTGTPAYMSPEQASGEGELSAASDVYALGCVLYEMLAGEPPVSDTETQRILSRKLLGQFPPLREVRPDVPQSVDTVVTRALETEPAHRFATASALVEALGAGVALEAGPTGTRPRLPWAAGAAAVVLVGAAYGIWSRPGSTEVSAASFEGRPSIARAIAVLPFENNSPASDSVDWFVSAIREEVAKRLRNLGGLTVRPTTSVTRVYGAGDRSHFEIANELKVDALLEAWVEVIDNRFRVSLSLIDVEGDTALWQKSYDGDYTTLPDIFDKQSDVAEQVASALGAELTPQELERIERRPTENMQAWILYNRGRLLFSKVTPESLHRAIELYNLAIEEDPRFGDPYAALGQAYSLLAHVEQWRPEERAARATAAAEAALRVDSTLAEAYATLGERKLRFDRDFFAADHDFETALRLDSTSAMLHMWYAQVLSNLRRDDEAISHVRRAQELDPVDPFIAANVAFTYYNARRYDEAEAEAHKALELDSLHFVPHWNIGLVRSARGDYDAAIAELELALDLAGGAIEPLPGLGFAYARAGRRAEAKEVLRQLKDMAETDYVAASYVALVYAGLDENDLAFEWLERAYQERDILLLWISFPLFDSLRPDPRFRELERKIGLTDYIAARNRS